jgi:3-isopropylmalate/(R)-2-methylmalate dehydratase small subunit
VEIDLVQCRLTNLTTKEVWELKPLGEVAPIIEAGGLFPYARKVGMLAK